MAKDHHTEGILPEERLALDALNELERLLADPDFHAPERNRCFLRYVVAETLAGRSARIKAFTIATDVFGRKSDFEPTLDPIVRIEAARLRSSLSTYYDTHRQSSVRIEIPKGRYVPAFLRIEVEAPERIDHADTAEPSEVDLRATIFTPTFIKLGSVAGLLTIVCIALTFIVTAKTGLPFTSKPELTISLQLPPTGEQEDAGEFMDRFTVAVGQFQTIRFKNDVVPSTTNQHIIPSSLSALFTDKPTPRYALTVKYLGEPGHPAVWWQLTNSGSGETIGSAIQTADASLSMDDAIEALSSQLARKLVGQSGLINSIEVQKDYATPSLGNGCILRAEVAARRTRGPELKIAETCLEETVARSPNDADSNAQLAILLLSKNHPSPSSAEAARALDLANYAVILAPSSDRSRYALMLAEFEHGKISSAIASGSAALMLNPNNRIIADKLALIAFTTGITEGKRPGAMAIVIDDATGVDAVLVRALGNYQRGAYADAVADLRQIMPSDDSIIPMLLIAAYGQQGDAKRAQSKIAHLSATGKQTVSRFIADMSSRHYSPELISSIAGGLIKANLPAS